MSDLKPCPRCKSKADWCNCDNPDCMVIVCECSEFHSLKGETAGDVAKEWNTRPPSKLAKVREAVGKLDMVGLTRLEVLKAIDQAEAEQ